jgi:hypothetical protein
MDHVCEHPHFTHQCHCGMERNHTTLELTEWYDFKGLTPLESEVV